MTPRQSSFVVAEIGMNHMGDLAYASMYLAMFETTAYHGGSLPDGLTFQVREPEYYEPPRPEASLRLADEDYRKLALQTKRMRIQFGVALCDPSKIPLFEEIGTDFYKVLSKDFENTDLIGSLLRTGKPVHVSTGTAGESDIERLLSDLRVDERCSNLHLLHTQLSYDDANVNLRAIGRLQERFGKHVGYGLHSKSALPMYAALGFSPSAIFFYVKGHKPIRHRDEDHAFLVTTCPSIIADIRRIETMLGDGIKRKMKNEIPDQKRNP